MTESVYDFMYIMPLCLVAAIFGHSDIGVSEITPLFYAVVILAGTVCILFRHMKARGRIITVGIAGALFLGVVLVREPQERSAFIHDKLWVLWIVLICMGCFFAGKLITYYRKLRLAAAVCGLVALIVIMTAGIAVEKIAVMMLLFLIVISVVEEIQLHWKKEGHTDSRKHLVFISPFLIALFLAAILIKTPDKPYDWKFVKDFANAARIRLELLYQTLVPEKGWDSSDAAIGFSDRGEIGGNISSRAYEVLGMTSDYKDNARMYFGGKTFDTFDGRKWSKEDESKTDYAAFDTLESVSAVMTLAPECPSDYLRTIKTNVSYVGVKTSCAFIPPKMLAVTSDDVELMKGGDIAFSTRRKNGDDYTIQYYKENRENPDFQEMLRRGQDFDEATWRAALTETGKEELPQYSYEKLMAYRDEIRKVYGQPVELSSDMRVFLDDLLEGAETDMDKLERIEKLLCGYQYSNQPGDIPDTVTSPSEYLDYFILDKKEGFCSHYATAFVLLARAEGIPARYVQGYSVCSDKTHIDVTSDQAHAWPEAYIEGYGWLGFEPTPGYKRTSGWTVVEHDGQGTDNPYTDYQEQYGKAEEALENEGEEEPAEKQPVNWKRVLVPAGLCALFLLLFMIADRIRKKNRYQKMSNRDKVVTLCRRNMKRFRRMGYQLAAGETLSEYRNRAGKTVPEEILSFIDSYEKVSYADKEIGDQELKNMERISADCDRYVWHEMWKHFRERQKEARMRRYEKAAGQRQS